MRPGHADMVELPNGEWIMVCLGIRNEENRGSNMGRETLILPVVWEKEPFWWKEIKYNWPVCNPLTGKIEKQYPYFLPINDSTYEPTKKEYEFQENTLPLNWIHRRVPLENSYSLNTKTGYLSMYCLPDTIKERSPYNFIGIKQKETHFETSTTMQFNPNINGEEAGLCLIQKDDNYILFDVRHEDNENVLRLVINAKKKNALLQKDLVMGKKYKNYIELKVILKENKYHFYYRYQSNDLWELFDTAASHILLSEGYTGSHIGLYATSNDKKSINFASFDVFKLSYPNP